MTLDELITIALNTAYDFDTPESLYDAMLLDDDDMTDDDRDFLRDHRNEFISALTNMMHND